MGNDEMQDWETFRTHCQRRKAELWGWVCEKDDGPEHCHFSRDCPDWKSKKVAPIVTPKAEEKSNMDARNTVAMNAETMKHVNRVQRFVRRLIRELSMRVIWHDSSKFKSPEVEIFARYTPKLKDTTYGSDEYKRFLEEMKPAIEHHYQENRHHPEHFENGIEDMNLIDILEMLCDWRAATERHSDGNIEKSIDINKIRFGLSQQLVKILKNTVRLLENGDK
jgi:hypothetical protein